jgi:hypothetical protein
MPALSDSLPAVRAGHDPRVGLVTGRHHALGAVQAPGAALRVARVATWFRR